MGRIEEVTLFQPDAKLQFANGSRSGGGAGGGGGGARDEDEGPTIGLGQRVAEAMRSARRRKGLSFLVVLVGAALTLLGVIFAPRAYEIESRVLVQRTGSPAAGQGQWVSPEESRNLAREYEEQVMARDNILSVVRQKNLVARWDAMRQPHRRLIDKLNAKLGKQAPTDDEKFEALVVSIERRMKVWVDATTVTIKLEWPDPDAGRDIVDAAVRNFLDARFQAEVGVIPGRLKVIEGFVVQARKELENAANELVRAQRDNDPQKKKAAVAAAFMPVQNPREAQAALDADVATKAKLDAIRAQIAQTEGAKVQRVQELNQQLVEKQQVFGPSHPEVIALKQTLAATQAHEPPQLGVLKAEEAALKSALDKDVPKRVEAPRLVRAPVQPPAPGTDVGATAATPKSLQEAQLHYEAARDTYLSHAKQLQELQLQMQDQQVNYNNRYKITRPAEAPAGPKRPVELIALAIGVMFTLMAVLVLSALADRLSGIFYEPRDVRDRLRLPVFATFS